MFHIRAKPGIISDWRIRAGYTLVEAAEKMGISDNSIRRIEKGTQFPKGKTAEKIHRAMGMEFDDVFEIVEW